MKKILLLVFCLLMLNIDYLYADDNRFSEWGDIKTNYPEEKEKIVFGYLYPIEWSSWSPEYLNDPYTRSMYRPWPTEIDRDHKNWNSTRAQTLYSWPLSGEYSVPKKLMSWYIDIDAYCNYDYSISTYYEPKMNLTCTLESGNEIIVDSTPGRGGSEHNMSINMDGDGEYLCKKVTLYSIADVPHSGNFGKANTMTTVYSYVSFEELCYSTVIKWSEGVGWRDEIPYVDTYGENPIKAVSKYVYSHPLYYFIKYELDGGEFIEDYPKIYYPEDGVQLVSPYKKGYEFIGFHEEEDLSDPIVSRINVNRRGSITLYAEYKRMAPIIEVDKRYIYEDDDIETINDLASATDELDGDISDDVIIKEIYYEDTGNTDSYPSSFNSNESDIIYVTYYVVNSSGIEEEKRVKLYVLRDGKFVDLHIYNRYISKEYKDTLDVNSIWRNDNYNNSLNKAIEWLERK